MNDSLGDRMKEYERRSRLFLPLKSYSIIRVDGKAFHSFAKNFDKPFDNGFIEAMNKTALYMCENIQCAKMAYVQSDEISIVLSDLDNINTEMWFNGAIQKIVSVSASLATSKFNRIMDHTIDYYKVIDKLAQFDARVFNISQVVEVHNYFVWRQKDCIRNSIQMIAQSKFSHKSLQNLNSSQLQEKLFQEAGINWNDYNASLKRGRMVVRELSQLDNPSWIIQDAVEFTQNPTFIPTLLQLPNEQGTS